MKKYQKLFFWLLFACFGPLQATSVLTPVIGAIRSYHALGVEGLNGLLVGKIVHAAKAEENFDRVDKYLEEYARAIKAFDVRSTPTEDQKQFMIAAMESYLDLPSINAGFLFAALESKEKTTARKAVYEWYIYYYPSVFASRPGEKPIVHHAGALGDELLYQRTLRAIIQKTLSKIPNINMLFDEDKMMLLREASISQVDACAIRVLLLIQDLAAAESLMKGQDSEIEQPLKVFCRELRQEIEGILEKIDNLDATEADETYLFNAKTGLREEKASYERSLKEKAAFDDFWRENEPFLSQLQVCSSDLTDTFPVRADEEAQSAYCGRVKLWFQELYPKIKSDLARMKAAHSELVEQPAAPASGLWASLVQGAGAAVASILPAGDTRTADVAEYCRLYSLLNSSPSSTSAFSTDGDSLATSSPPVGALEEELADTAAREFRTEEDLSLVDPTPELVVVSPFGQPTIPQPAAPPVRQGEVLADPFFNYGVSVISQPQTPAVPLAAPVENERAGEGLMSMTLKTNRLKRKRPLKIHYEEVRRIDPNFLFNSFKRKASEAKRETSKDLSISIPTESYADKLPPKGSSIVLFDESLKTPTADGASVLNVPPLKSSRKVTLAASVGAIISLAYGIARSTHNVATRKLALIALKRILGRKTPRLEPNEEAVIKRLQIDLIASCGGFVLGAGVAATAAAA